MNEAEEFLDESKEKETTQLTFRDKVKRILESHQFHTAVIVLVIIDCLCVAIELILDFMEKESKSPMSAHLDVIKSNHSLLNSSENLHHQPVHHHSNTHMIIEILEKVLKYTSLSILGFFVIEITFKIAFIPKVFVKNKFEIFDAVVVIISFATNLFLFFYKHIVYSIGALLTILRLWRITEIINAAILAIENRHEIKVKKLKNTIRLLEEENKRLRQLVSSSPD